MKRRNFILSILATGFFVAIATLTPDLATAQADKVKAALADLKARTEKLGAARVEGKDLYFGGTKMGNDFVDAVVKASGEAATLFVKSGNDYIRVATTVKKEDGSSAVGTTLDATSPALAKISSGEAYYGDVTVFGKPYIGAYEPIKDASGGLVGAYFYGQQK
jgi:Cache 3/Cache 2 fusion domain